MRKSRFWTAVCFLLVSALLLAVFPMQTEAKSADGKTVIVIDPGHGGSDPGAQEPPFGEGSMTLYLSLWEAQYLQCYDNVEVYLTRTDDSSVGLKERVNFAVSKHADFFACNHFNDSENPVVSGGSEVYVSINQSLFPQEAFFAQTELDELSTMGLNVRGIKFRVGDHGDYYSVLRNCSKNGLEGAIIEHCFLNNESDRKYLGGGDTAALQNVLQTMAYADARAIAKHLHLKSTIMGVDYTDYQENEITWPVLPFSADM